MSFGVVPFSRLPRKRYRPEQEPHVIRVDLDHLRNTVSEYNSDEDEEDPTGLDDLERLSHSSGDDSSASSSSSYSSYSSLSSKHSPLNQQNISTLGSHHSNRSNNFDKTNYDENDDQDSVSSLHTRTTIAATNTMNLPTVTTPVVTRKNKTILNSFLKSIQRYIKSRRSYVLFQLWRERKAKERRSAMLINLEKKGEILKEKIYNEIQQELLEDEIAVEKHTKKLLRIQKTFAHRQYARLQKDKKFEKDKQRREREFQKMEYNVFHMQLWAKESHEKAILLQQEREQQILQTQRREAQRKKEMDRLEYYAKDSENLKKDIEETQALQKTMRQCGIKPGVNAITHQLPPQEQLETTRFLSFKLRDDVNLEWKLKHQRTPDILMPFDIDLKLYRDVETLRGVNIGERGALALASEFVRGACSNLLTLDLSRCQIHSRGFSRVLHGLRMGRVLNLQSLKVRGNSLTPSAVEYLKAAFQNYSLRNLKEIDLRDNEIGDEGANTIAHMMIADLLQGITILLLQRNSITDIGVSKIVNVLKAVITQKCPQLSLLSLQENHATTLGKLRLKPLPFGVSI